MLILSRKVREKIIILTSDGQVEVSVKEIKKGVVQLAVSAPKNVKIDREEIHQKNMAAKGTEP